METPWDAEGNKICQGCDGPIVQSGIGRSRDYCSRLCRDRAYKVRRDRNLFSSPGRDRSVPWNPAGIWAKLSAENLRTIKVPDVLGGNQVALPVSVAVPAPPVTPASALPFGERSP
ncbi:hypothetical protein OG215_38230 (plasmid) [Streptomyces globisporus]|uniref:hypothetical protein n=1 Tax=Streptomyces globisporus TaxID=1908 RepID=UPI002F90F48B|nr:hypothetical protein OG215_38085 [Streptomyces globisporus]WSU86461.1 hypothetical protein OG215_38230 [Streptomyces globisporus]